MISAETVTLPASASVSPSPARRTSPSVIVSPASPASFSTAILSPAATRYCLPPVRTTANMVFKSVRYRLSSFGCPRLNDKKGAHRGTESRPPLGQRRAPVNAAERHFHAIRRAGNRRRGQLRRMAMRFNRALLLTALGCSLGACMASDKYPSLAIRDAERAAGTMQPAEPEPYVPPAPPAAVLGRLDQLTGEAASAHQAFLAEAPKARSAVAAARGAGPGADSWARAQVAVAGLESARSRAMIALADLDRLYVDAAVGGEELTRIGAVRDQVAAQVGEQDATIAGLLGELR